MAEQTTIPEQHFVTLLAQLVSQHLHDESGDGDACVTVGDRQTALQLRDEILRQCTWLKDCSWLGSQEGAHINLLLSDMSNESIHITTDPDFELSLPPWIGLRVRWGQWQ